MKRQVPFSTDLGATVALCGYSLAVAIGFARVFAGWGFMVDLATIAIIGHGLSLVMRRVQVRAWLAIPVLSGVMVWLLALLHYRDTMSTPIPWSATGARVRFDLALVREEFPNAVAPVLYDVVGWAALASIALALVVVLSDSFAFHAEARGEALVPGGVLFVFIAALGIPRMQVASAMLLIATGVLAVVALRRLHDRERGAHLTPRGSRSSLIAPAALGSAVCIALIAGVIGPRLPGAHADPLYDTKGRSGTSFIDNPMVDIRSRLTNRGNVELFRVNADEERYWRSITLAEFTGDQFRLPQRPLAEIDESAAARSTGAEVRIRQQVQIVGMRGELVPAAADPLQASGTHVGGEPFTLRQQREANTLLAPGELLPGDLIDIVSVAPDPTADELRAAGVGNVPDPIYLELPDNLPAVLFEQTDRLTAGLPTAFDQARALQDWFRDPNEFRYSTEVQSGHGTNAIESFFRVRAGYCEQFSATFAAMARAAGIPSRVAVGFTPGVQQDSGWYTVIGKNAHAWPELWFDGIGWVPFEPTPGRGVPGATAYTGLPPEQDESGPSVAGPNGIPDDFEPAPTVPPTVLPGDDTPTTPPELPDPGEGLNGDTFFPEFGDDMGAPGGSVAPSEDSFPWGRVLLVGAFAAALVAPAAIRRLSRIRRRALPPREQVSAAWHRARAAALDIGVAGTPAMTASEWTIATSAVIPVAARPMRSLAEVIDRVMFAPAAEVDFHHRGAFGDRLTDDCELWANQVERIVVDTLPPAKRIQRYFTNLK